MNTVEVAETIPILLRSVRRPRTALSALLGVLTLETQAAGAALIARFADGETQVLGAGGEAAGDFGPLGPGPWSAARFQKAGGMVAGPDDVDYPWSEGDRLEWRTAPGDDTALLLVAFGEELSTGGLDVLAGLSFLLGELVLSRQRSETLEGRLKMERQDRALIAASLQHDLRTPLSSIFGFARLLRDGDDLPPAERTELLDLIATEAERMTELVSDGLNREAASPDSPLKLQSIDALDLAKNVAAVAGEEAARLMLGIQSATLVTDVSKVTRALLNLVDNALRYGPDDSPVHLSGRPESDQYHFVVADSGPGVPEEMVHTLFQPYSTDPSRNDGTGLGLYSVAKIAAELGGRVAYARREGWTTFSLWVDSGSLEPGQSLAEAGRTTHR